MIWKTSIMLAVMMLMLAMSAASAANEIYLDPHPVYIPECGNATVQVLLNATDAIDTWSTKIGFGDICVNITDVDFTDSISTNASWGHHGNYIYLGGVSLDSVTGNGLVLANLTVECDGSCGLVDLELFGIVDVERLIAGPPDGEPPHGTIRAATWTGGNAQCVGCGDANGDGFVTAADAYPVFTRTVCNDWVADANGDGFVTAADAYPVFARILNCRYPCK